MNYGVATFEREAIYQKAVNDCTTLLASMLSAAANEQRLRY